MWPYYSSMHRPYLLRINFVFQLRKYSKMKQRTAIIYPEFPIGKCYLKFIVISCLYCFYSWIHAIIPKNIDIVGIFIFLPFVQQCGQMHYSIDTPVVS